MVVVVVPLMFETGFDKLCDCIINVSCDDDVRINRLVSRDNITKDLANKIISSQISDKERCEKSDYVIKNNFDIDQLKKDCLVVLKSILEKQK